eukprot:Seg623.6 transcript_id=Seg623.6/GoldUCD/mRNA.D3Y31 product="hypothetical protein" protein_id=Seg623.6/GoldUCD/D3Y31
MKTSTRNSKAEVETPGKAEMPDRSETPKGRRQSTPLSTHTWHSTPKPRKSLERTDDFYSRDIKSKKKTSNGSVVSSKDQYSHETPEKFARKLSEGSNLGSRKAGRVERSLTVDSSSLESKMEDNSNLGSRKRNDSYRMSCERTTEKQTDLLKTTGPKTSSKERSLSVDSNCLGSKMEDNSNLGSRKRNDSYRMSCERTTEQQTDLSKTRGPKISPKECSSTVDSSSCEGKLADHSNPRNNSYKIACKRTDDSKATERNSQFGNRTFAVGSESLDYRCEENNRRKQSFDHFSTRNECSKGRPNCLNKDVDYNSSKSASKRDCNSMSSDRYDINHKESFDCSRKSSSTYCDKKVTDSNHKESFDLGRKSKHSCSDKKPIGNVDVKHNCNERITGDFGKEEMAEICLDCLSNQNKEAARRRSSKQTEKYTTSRRNQDENSAINSDELRPKELVSIPDASPRILRETIPESSPSLIRNNLDYFSYLSDFDTTPRIEVGSSKVETRTRSSIDSIYDNDIDIDDVKLDFLAVPAIVGSPADSYTSDEDSQLDRYISKMVNNRAADRSLSRGSESDSRGQDQETAQLKENNVNKQKNFLCNDDRLKNHKLTSNLLSPRQNGLKYKKNRNVDAESILAGKQPYQQHNGIAGRSPHHEQKSKFRSKSPKLSVPNSPSLTPIDGHRLSLPENSRKGIKLSVSRAKKKLLDFTSPRISRKKEKYFQSFDDSEIYDEEESKDKVSLQGERAKESPYPLNKTEMNFGSSDSSCCESQRLSQNGHIQSLVDGVNNSPTGRINLDLFPRRNRERDKMSSTSSGWSDLGQSNLAFDRKVSNSESISAIDNKSHSSRNASEGRPTTIGCDSFDELSEATERARSPSIVSNLSISSHFNLTVKRFLETSDLGVTRVGNSVFYCDSESVKSVKIENSGEITPWKSDSVTRLTGDSKQIAENEVVQANGYVPNEVEQPLVVDSVSTSEISKTEDSKFITDDQISWNLENPKMNSADAPKKHMGAKAAIGHMAVSAAMGHVGVNAAKGQMAASGVNMHVAKDIANMVLPIV